MAQGNSEIRDPIFEESRRKAFGIHFCWNIGDEFDQENDFKENNAWPIRLFRSINSKSNVTQNS